MIIAIDFDSTITEESEYLITGAIRTSAKIFIPKLVEDGHTLILWTARSNDNLKEAINLLEDAGLLKYFKYINDDGFDYGNRKICADFYFDDRSLLEPVDWEKFYNYIRERGEN